MIAGGNHTAIYSTEANLYLPHGQMQTSLVTRSKKEQQMRMHLLFFFA